MVHIVRGQKNLASLLGKNKELSGTAFALILDENEAARQELSRYHIREIPFTHLDPGERRHFLGEYIDLIGMVGRECNSTYWWATDMSSKNRSTCRLPFLLYEFLFIVKLISETSGSLVVINPSWVILNCLAQYMTEKDIEFNMVRDNASYAEPVIMKIRNLFRMIHIMITVQYRRFYFSRLLGKRLKALTTGRKYYLIKTFLYDHSFDDNRKYKDTFFGIIPHFLKEKKDVLVLANVLGTTRFLGHAMRQCDSHFIIPLEMFMPLTDVMKAARQVTREKIALINRYSFLGHDVTAIIRDELNRTGDGIAFYQFLHYIAMRRFLDKIQVETLLLTYENNPWEKMCMLAVKESSHPAKTIGYQHSVVPEASANAFLSRYESGIVPVPDRILTVGEAPKRIMERYGSFEPGKIKAACGLRFEYLFHISRHVRKRDGHIFLALEGLDGAHKLLNYAMRHLKGNSYYTVRFRTHPEMPFREFEKKLVYPLENVPNFCQTNNLFLKDDLEWADMVLYWGSTVSLEAVLSGRPLVRYNMDSVLNYDPLFECEHLKWTVHDGLSLVDIIEQIYSLDDETFDREWSAARDYISQYFFPITPDRLRLFMSETTGDNDGIS